MKQDVRFRTTFGQLIESLLDDKSERLGRRVTLNELCFRAQADVSNVWRSMYLQEREGRPPSPDILRRLAPHLPISYADLLKGSGHIDIAQVIYEQEVLETKIDADPTLAPDIKMQLKSYLQFLRRSPRTPRFAL